MTDIFVFGSNRSGRHGAGAALYAAEHHGAIRGQAEGLQGQSYAIMTKELRHGHPPVTLLEIAAGVTRFLAFAANHPELTFRVTLLGCGLARFMPYQIAPMFAHRPDNVILPDGFKECQP